jgi:Fe2+ or Zn2+ uptake regulation protein
MEPEINVECLRQQLRALGHIYSIERENLMRAVYSMAGEYSLHELFQEARKQNAIHAKSTIHRNIGIFLKAGFIRKIEISGKRKKYETITFVDQESGLSETGNLNYDNN